MSCTCQNNGDYCPMCLANWAEREAKGRLRDNRRINEAEFAYSPLTGAVGIRWDEYSTFRVFNTQYPMYKQSEEVHDWVSVGKGTHILRRIAAWCSLPR